MIVIVDFGSQYTHLISRRIRALGVNTEIVPPLISTTAIRGLSPEGIILSGGPASVYARGAPAISHKILEIGAPILGICYGHQLLARLLGGRVKRGRRAEYGREVLRIVRRGALFHGLNTVEHVWFSHGDEIVRLPRGFMRLAGTSHVNIGAFGDEKRALYGLQFHPEVSHTTHGEKVLRNFLFLICRAQKDWRPAHLVPTLSKEMHSRMQDGKAIVAVSGGVDSTIAALLTKRAIGPLRTIPIFLDTGMLRKGESPEVMARYRDLGLRNVLRIDAAKEFLHSLYGIRDPEEKRHAVSRTYFSIFEQAVERLKHRYPNIRYLVQGTIYPDRIESAKSSGQAAKIKSHHNVTVPKKFGLEIVEPLRDFYKDEVRKLGKAVGCPRKILERHPFPGPGLAIRILGDVTPEKVKILQEADAIFIRHLRAARLYRKIWQAFAALLDAKAVGVTGDSRRYGYIVALRAVTSRDGMTADWARIPDRVLEKVANEIVSAIPQVARVVYDVTQKPPATIEFE